MTNFKLSTNKQIAILATITFALIILSFFLPTIPQNPEYHNFADARNFLSIPNFANVISNIFFVIVGVYGLFITLSKNNINKFIDKLEKYPFVVLFSGLILTGFGSTIYHLNPNNISLFWDRAPMTIVAMGFLAILLSDRISPKFGFYSLIPLIALGILSVGFWEYTEFLGKGDLRFYYFVSYYPIIMLPILLLFFPSRYTGNYFLIEAVLWYALAKITESFDKQIYAFTNNIISGHTIKHVVAAIAIYSFARYLKYRKIKINI